MASGEANAGRAWERWRSSSHSIPVPLRMATTSCLQLSLAAQIWNDSSTELVTPSVIDLVIKKWQRCFYFFFFSFSPNPPACWGRKTPGIIFHQCLTQPFLSSVAFPSLRSGIALKTAPSCSPQLLLFTGIVSSFPAECNFLEKKESSTWSNISTEICYSSQSCLASYKLPHEIQLCEF